MNIYISDDQLSDVKSQQPWHATHNACTHVKQKESSQA